MNRNSPDSFIRKKPGIIFWMLLLDSDSGHDYFSPVPEKGEEK